MVEDTSGVARLISEGQDAETGYTRNMLVNLGGSVVKFIPADQVPAFAALLEEFTATDAQDASAGGSSPATS